MQEAFEDCMLLSVIVPVYNNEKFVDAALLSLYRQNLREGQFEVIVIDDGSTDGSLKLINNFAGSHENVKVLPQSNRGVSAARNAGLDIARGRYVAFLDGDDEFCDDALKLMVQCAEDRHADLVIGTQLSVQPFKTRRKKASNNLSKLLDIQRENEDIAYNFSVANKLFRTSVVNSMQLRFSSLKHAEDGLFLYSYLDVCGTITGCDCDVYKYYSRLPVLSKSTLRRLDTSKFEDVTSAVNQIIAIAASWDCPELVRCLETRYFRTTLISEYYRHLWALDEQLSNRIVDLIDKLSLEMPDEEYDAISNLFPDIGGRGHFLSREEIAEQPLVSVIYCRDIEPDMLSASLATLFYQSCPNFEVLIPSHYRGCISEDVLDNENVFFYNAQSTQNEIDSLNLCRGQIIQVVDCACMYADDSLRVAVRKLLSEPLDMLCMRPMLYNDGEIQKIKGIGSCYTKEALLSDQTCVAERSRHNEVDCFMANKLFKKELLSSVGNECACWEQVLSCLYQSGTSVRYRNPAIAIALNNEQISQWKSEKKAGIVRTVKRKIRNFLKK